MDFAPYQDTSPDTNRLASPPTSPIGGEPNAWASPRSSTSQNRPSPPAKPKGHIRNPSNNQSSNYFGGHSSYEPIGDSSHTYHIPQTNQDAESGLGGGSRGREALNDFETSLPLRLDYEACLAYLLLPPVGGVILLIMEWKSDYVRFHAWQSALLFSFLFFVHLLFSWSRFMSWVIFLGDLGLIAYLTMRAYVDADTLDRYEVPFFGPLASRFVDDE